MLTLDSAKSTGWVVVIEVNNEFGINGIIIRCRPWFLVELILIGIHGHKA